MPHILKIATFYFFLINPLSILEQLVARESSQTTNLLDLCRETRAPLGFPRCLTFFHEAQCWKLAKGGTGFVCEDQWRALWSVPGTRRNPTQSCDLTKTRLRKKSVDLYDMRPHQMPVVTESGVIYAKTSGMHLPVLPQAMWCDSEASASLQSFLAPDVCIHPQLAMIPCCEPHSNITCHLWFSTCWMKTSSSA